jgi:hypothetical protein
MGGSKSVPKKGINRKSNGAVGGRGSGRLQRARPKVVFHNNKFDLAGTGTYGVKKISPALNFAYNILVYNLIFDGIQKMWEKFLLIN